MLLEQAGIGRPAQVLPALVTLVEDQPGHCQPLSKGRCGDECLECLVYGSQLVWHHDQQGVTEFHRQVGNKILLADGGEKSATSLDKHNITAFLPAANTTSQKFRVDPAALLFRGQGRGKGCLETLGTDIIEREGLPGRFPDCQCIIGDQPAPLPATSAGDRFVNAHFFPGGMKCRGDLSRDHGLADLGIGTGNKQAHGLLNCHG